MDCSAADGRTERLTSRHGGGWIIELAGFGGVDEIDGLLGGRDEPDDTIGSFGDEHEEPRKQNQCGHGCAERSASRDRQKR